MTQTKFAVPPDRNLRLDVFAPVAQRLPAWVAWVAVGASALLVAAVNPWSERLARIERLTPAEREHLARQRQRLDELPAEQQLRLRRLADELDAAPDGPRLERVMLRYFDWLQQSVSVAERAELRGLPLEERVARIARWQRDRVVPREIQLGADDRAQVAAWVEALVTERFGNRGDGGPRSGSRRQLWTAALLNRTQEGSLRSALPSLSPEDLRNLAERLSPATRAAFRSSSHEAQRRMVYLWIRQAIQSRLPEVAPDALARYFEESLSANERDQLLALEPEEMELRLRLRYLKAQRSDRPRGRTRREAEDQRPPPGGQPKGQPASPGE